MRASNSGVPSSAWPMSKAWPTGISGKLANAVVSASLVSSRAKASANASRTA